MTRMEAKLTQNDLYRQLGMQHTNNPSCTPCLEAHNRDSLCHSGSWQPVLCMLPAACMQDPCCWQMRWIHSTACLLLRQCTCLCFREAQMKSLAQVLDTARAGLECWAAAALHHLHQQNNAICMLAACQEALYTQHLHPLQAPLQNGPVK